jgi:succinate dehydrogenase / fumarate reductase flavoprotein subunit
MRIYPAVHYTMGGLWVDYHLQTTIPGLFCLGEANFSDHGANRLGASALMQGLADGYFIISHTLGNYLAGVPASALAETSSTAFKSVEADVKGRLDKLMGIKGKRTVDSFHKELGKVMWDYCGMARDREGLKKAIGLIQTLKQEYWENVNVPGSGDSLNQSLEKAGRVADFIELGELMCRDALDREESCGGHFRTEYQEEGEAKRNDDEYAYVAAWEYAGEGKDPILNKEPLVYENVHLSTRSYK